jgi:glucose/arabinose dehydrogenase
MIRFRFETFFAGFGLALLTTGLSLPAHAQAGGGQDQANQAPAAGGAGGRGRGGFLRAATLGDGPWDFETQTGPVHLSVVTRELDHPWSLVFLPDGDMLLTERPGRLRLLHDGKLDPSPIEGVPDVVPASIGGLMGLALHPDFRDNRLIYFAYTKPMPGDRALTSLAVARARWDGGHALADVEDIFVAKDWYSGAMADENNRCCGQGPASGSYGARIAFDDNNFLYVTSGDRNWGEKAQDPQSDLGKIIRLRDDGSIPDSNPYVGMDGYLPELYTIGHRNPTGLRFDPRTGDLWSTEFGPRGGDELNRIEAGKNYGWILITQGAHYNDEEKVLGDKGIEGYVDPVFAWGVSGNPGNLVFYTGDAFPAWTGNVFVATMARPTPALERITLDKAGRFVSRERLFEDLGQRMRDVVQGPDDLLYVATDETAGAILKIEPGH